MQKYLSKSVIEALTKTVKETYSDVSFMAIRLDQDAKWKSSLAKKLTAETMTKINDHLGASANDVLLIALGPKESAVRMTSFSKINVNFDGVSDTLSGNWNSFNMPISKSAELSPRVDQLIKNPTSADLVDTAFEFN